MKTLFSRKPNNFRNLGFTIVELLVVITILGVLAGIVTMSYSNITKRARVTAIKYDLAGAAKQLENDKAINDTYPTTLESANNNRGLIKSVNTIYQYNVLGSSYCLSASHDSDTSIVYRITSDSNIAIEGSCINSWKAIGAGTNQSCAINFSNKTYCWGNNYNGELGDGTFIDRISPTLIAAGAIPSSVYLISIDSGDDHTCGLASNNKVYCWGANYVGQVGTGSSSPRYLNVPTLVVDGVIPTDVTIKSIAVGSMHTCALGSNGRVYCWGYGGDGQIGNGSTTSRTTPNLVSMGAIPGGVTIESIKANNNFTCGLGSNGRVYCWGDNYMGQLGNNSTTNSTTPVAVLSGVIPGGVTLKSIAAGAYHMCAIGSDDEVYCWGYNVGGQLGNGDNVNQGAPVRMLDGEIPNDTKIVSLESAWYSTCGLDSNNITYCWGENMNQQIGNDTVTGSNTPMAVTSIALPNNTKISHLSGGVSYMCGLTLAGGTTYCWGDNMSGQLGLGITNNKNSPTAVWQGQIPGGVTIQKVSAGNFLACALGSDGKSYCWGHGLRGELGSGTDIQSNIPVATVQGEIPDGVTAKDLATGWSHTCMVGTDDWLYCWGDNTDGQLGNGNNNNSNIPVALAQGAIPGGVKVKTLMQGGDFTCIVGTDDKAYCWGWNGYNALGDGTTNDSNVPVAVAQGAIPGGVTIKSIATTGNAGHHVCIIGTDDKSYCWGYNNVGQLGNNTQVSSGAPVEVLAGAIPGGVVARSISIGLYHSCIIGSNERIYCWGYNVNKELGVSSGNFYRTPVASTIGAIPAGTIKSLVAARDRTCVIGSNDKAYCWGSNQFGTLGIGIWSAPTHIPTIVANGESAVGTFKSISPSFLHSCGVTIDSKAYCWGSGYRGGLLGNGAIDSLGYPMPIASF